MPANAITNTSAAPGRIRRHGNAFRSHRRSRCGRAKSGPARPATRSAVRCPACWYTAVATVATTLPSAVPITVPATPNTEATVAAEAAARLLASTCPRLRLKLGGGRASPPSAR